MFDATKCALENTRTMCIVRSLWYSTGKETVAPRTVIYGRSGEYYTVLATENWERLTAELKADLTLVDDTGQALVEFTWHEGEQGVAEATAREQIQFMLEALGSEPTVMEIPYEPWASNGIVYPGLLYDHQEDGGMHVLCGGRSRQRHGANLVDAGGGP